MTKINFTECFDAQDMIRIIMNEKSLTQEDSVKFAVNKSIYTKIIKAGYASIALGLWGHEIPDREWETLANPIMELSFDENQQALIEDIMKKEKVDFNTAISYFLLFTMEALGHHI